MRAALLAFLVLLPGGARAASAIVVDLSGQFPDAATRDQGDTGSCHVFTTISLIEAALYRAYELRLPLSEADLFVRKVITDPDYYEEARKAVGAEQGTTKAYKFVEGGSPYDDIRFVFDTGVAKAATAPWDAFSKRYAAYEKKQTELVEAERLGVVDGAKFYEENQGQIRRDYDVVGQHEASGLSDRTAQIQRETIRRLDVKVTSARATQIQGFQSYLSLIAGLSAASAEKLLLGEDPQLAKDRAAVKVMLMPMRVKKLDFPLPQASWAGADPDADCAKAGAARKLGLMAVLDKKIPVSVGMDLSGLPEWGKQASAHARHAFTITGYEKAADGTITLKSRNSWGGDNPDITEKRFCRIFKIVAVLTAKE